MPTIPSENSKKLNVTIILSTPLLIQNKGEGKDDAPGIFESSKIIRDVD